ncbi:hypothetical protein OCH239_11645 [Roseivivax halodurans JCM 10272]|uniref:DUF3616 domain-containing protein n=1 Tax=Roseivivax halodurans JCM 10272 TaxID=1449350 RepID=X7EKZ1_9RHOB|nr:hypothetical protein OCH239_11645 [Roseivivax halodurans JCM 10272]
MHDDISSVTRHGDSLFLCCDETAGVDRLTRIRDGVWGNHVHFNLGAIVDLPDGPDGEMDIEGLDCDGDWLWITGSHSLKRGKFKPGKHDLQEGLAAMARIKRDPNRYFLARMPLQEREDGFAIAAEDGDRRGAWIEMKEKSSPLIGWLSDDPHLAPFLDIPSKENGFDIEGMVGRGNRVWLGLRGPVLRDHAVILEFEMTVTKKGRLKPRKLEDGLRYRKHLLPSGGEGVRDLEVDGDDLLVLTGPVTAGDGRSDVWRWAGFKGVHRSGMVPPEALTHVAEMPYRGAVDHPEGLVRWPEVGNGFLVVYDSPASERLPEPETILGDIWVLD